MKLTKFQHACVLIEKDSSKVLIDPGAFSHDFIAPKHIDAIVITHDHPDHFDEKLVSELLVSSPQATIAAPESITARFPDHSTIPMATDKEYTVGALSLRFFGGTHAEIDPTMPVPANFGVLINGAIYYPGDSFVIPEGVTIDVLALPISAPWLKLHETLSFLLAIKPRIAFPTHDGILSEDGKAILDRMVSASAGANSIIYKRLDSSVIDL